MSPEEAQSVAPSRKGRWLRYAPWLLLIVPVGLAFLLHPVYSIIWQGGFQLELRLVSETGRRAETLFFVTEDKREMAEFIEHNPKADQEAGFRLAERRNDGFMAYIRTGGRDNAEGVEISYYEPRFLVIRARFAGGNEVRRVVEIPAGRGKRSVTVPLP